MNLENWQKFCDKFVTSIVIVVLIVLQQRWSGYKKRWHWYCRHIKKVSLVCSLEPEPPSVGYSFLIELFVSNVDDVVLMLMMMIMVKRRGTRMVMMMMVIRISRGNPVKSRNRQLLSMQHRQNNNKDILCNLERILLIFFVTMIKLIKTRILMQPPMNTAQTCAGGDD